MENIKSQIKNGTYDWTSAIQHTADIIISFPETLLWK